MFFFSLKRTHLRNFDANEWTLNADWIKEEMILLLGDRTATKGPIYIEATLKEGAACFPGPGGATFSIHVAPRSALMNCRPTARVSRSGVSRWNPRSDHRSSLPPLWSGDGDREKRYCPIRADHSQLGEAHAHHLTGHSRFRFQLKLLSQSNQNAFKRRLNKVTITVKTVIR